METDVNQDIQDYWNEVIHHDGPNDEELSSRSCDEGEAETELLKDLGLPQLTEPFKHGLEVAESDVEAAVQGFSKQQAEAIKRRVKTLNNTIRQRRAKAKHRKADVRDVFKDYENHSTGSQSRSATPDSLDSAEIRIGDVDSFNSTFLSPDNSLLHQKLKKPLSRVPSAPISHLQQKQQRTPSPHHNVSNSELFRHYMPDVAGTEKVCLVSYHYVGTLPRHRSGSDPSYLDVSADDENSDKSDQSDRYLPNSTKRLSRSFGNLLDVEDIRKSSLIENEDRTWIDSLDKTDIELLKPWFLAEVTSLLDANNKPIRKRKPVRSERKSESNVFGVTLSSLIQKDGRVSEDDCLTSNVPLVFQKLISHLEHRYLKEEGLLRMAGSKNRTEFLTNTIENDFYSDPSKVDAALYNVTAHDVASAIKKLLRELPEPLLTFKLMYMFYDTHGLSEDNKRKALNLLVLLLPKDHQSTLRYLLKFLVKISQYKEYNKMGIHSVATILAPSLFPPRYIRLSKDDMASQVKTAEICIQLTETLLNCGESLWIVPRNLITQLRNVNQSKHDRKENSKFFGKSRVKVSNRDNDLHDRIITVEAAQFGLENFRVRITKATTASDVILELMREVTRLAEQTKTTPKERSRPLSELAPRGVALSCILSAAKPDTALQSHFLYEYGGNIVQRELEHSALIFNVLEENKGASWRLVCRHRNCPKR